MAATTEQLKQILEDASRRAEQLPEWRRNDEVRRELEAIRQAKAARERDIP